MKQVTNRVIQTAVTLGAKPLRNRDFVFSSSRAGPRALVDAAAVVDRVNEDVIAALGVAGAVEGAHWYAFLAKGS